MGADSMSYTKSDLRYLLLVGIRKEYYGLSDRDAHKMADDIVEQVIESVHPMVTMTAEEMTHERVRDE